MADHIDAKHLKDARKAMMTCTYCGFCKSVCPIYEDVGWDSAVARGRIILAYGLLNKDIPADESVVKNLYQCTTCKDCERRCPSGIEVVDIVERARRDLVANDKMLPKHRKLVESTLKHGNPYGEEKGVAATLGQAKKHPASLGYFVGCTSAYRNRAIADATISITQQTGRGLHRAWTKLAAAACCSASAWTRKRCGTSWRGTSRSAADLGVEEVVFSCAGCYRMFKEEYPKHVDVPFKVRHISEFLADRDIKLKPLDKKITYHDPCHLGRHSGVYEAPRKLLSKMPGAEFKEMRRNRETALCCGGGAVSGRRIQTCRRRLRPGGWTRRRSPTCL